MSSPKRAEPQPAVSDRQMALEQAIGSLLDACGLDRQHKDFTSTPSRVARVWSQEFLSGFDMDPAKILGDPVVGEGESALVVVRGLPFHGLCPHHLLPYTGTATVAYLPATKLAGFGRLGDLVACFTRRLTLQERACNDVVDALIEHLGARGAGCVMRGRHTCLSIPDNKHDAQVVTSSVRGELSGRPDLQAQLFA
ncbi:GTP cyclohydrolase I [Nannocystis sp. RBIL2]|uniref:GTP cyclohydrolase I n=1 Tax=Nannocystis sp. RBIL2 TaxID=2996788 RepID=UPI00226DF712|nr:GTP cyclohydrolase I [Nannocystis sp. RBIL2]MCY1066624.1 GTP cyclohydrolase I [Nannocystis sp. RBIL2]